ncbi:MAG: hypothetical protein H0X62_06420 [Bacteroidetes bacterium]|nr:hypothetical protein [Bacteroidota bacterium]
MSLKRNLALAFLTIFICGATTLAQTSQQDVLYLKNGSIIRGNITEVIPSQSVKIEVMGNNVFVYSMDDVEKMAKENVANTDKIDNRIQSKVYYNVITPGLLIGENSHGLQIDPSLQIINGYRFSRLLSLGLGIGIEGISGYTILPIFLESRGFLFDKPSTPFYFVGAGYGIAHRGRYGNHETTRGGTMANVGLGLRTPMGKTGSFFTSIGYRYQYAYTKQTNIRWVWPEQETITTETINHFNRVSVNFGFMF